MVDILCQTRCSQNVPFTLRYAPGVGSILTKSWDLEKRISTARAGSITAANDINLVTIRSNQNHSKHQSVESMKKKFPLAFCSLSLTLSSLLMRGRKFVGSRRKVMLKRSRNVFIPDSRLCGVCAVVWYQPYGLWWHEKARNETKHERWKMKPFQEWNGTFEVMRYVGSTGQISVL